MKKKSLMLALILSITVAEGFSNSACAQYSSLYEAVHDSTAIRDYALGGT